MRSKLRMALVGVAMSAMLFGGAALPASADLDDYVNNPGRQQAEEVGAQCGTGAGSGAFGFLGGQDNNMSIPRDETDAKGANGYQTGLNNSAVCGNRQGSQP